ncbi:hypothetical protein [Methylobacterium indicum]|uniref:Uncharacterized protein n=1 Tax=Methylobacterium indicum TaxID=1775910 RepID=A0ABR5GZ87_9HYPH|nr:hypothetical protein [Methylobacterium indicum]KMO15767.1 hypothetical protein QR79_23810 [Methylobacterium indicum]KMO18043.1 hypothetical protein QR78_16155 [Methylobacterium indicum]
MADLIIPPVLEARSVAWMLRNTSRGGGASTTGQEQVVASPTGRWTASVTFNVFSGGEDAAVLAYRSLIRRGRSAVFAVPQYDDRGPGSYAGLSLPRQGVPHSDDSPFADGFGYSQRLASASFAGPVALNATQMQIVIGTGLILTEGMRFSTPDHRLYEIDEVLGWDGGNHWAVSIAPWTRAAYATGTELNFDTPLCRMRLATDDTGMLSVSTRSLSNPTIEFVEAF